MPAESEPHAGGEVADEADPGSPEDRHAFRQRQAPTPGGGLRTHTPTKISTPPPRVFPSLSSPISQNKQYISIQLIRPYI